MKHDKSKQEELDEQRKDGQRTDEPPPGVGSGGSVGVQVPTDQPAPQNQPSSGPLDPEAAQTDKPEKAHRK